MSRWMEFLFRSSTRYQLHSPFLYALINQVVHNRGYLPECLPAEGIRKQCLKNDEVILKTDYGTGADGCRKRIYPVKISDIARRSLTSPAKAKRLFRLAQFLQAQHMLEMGTSLGITASYLALSNRDAQLVTLEGCPELSRKAKEHFNQLELHNVDLLTGPFSETLGTALDRLGRADLVYIDGHHHGIAMLDYFNQCLPFITNGSIIVFDDIRYSPEVEKAWNTICGRQEVRVSLDFFSSGWVLFRKELSRQHFRLRYF
ncbi:MAG: class I SAM-dependent methyltransferase [Bacteroidales bacterium]